LEEQIEAMAADEKSGGRICFLKGYDQALAARMYASGDFFLIPSLYEPCGLTDYIAQLFGNLPVVHHVGGLVKVIDGETGFAYQDHTPEALAAAMRQALHLYRHDCGRIGTMQRAAVERIRSHHTWRQAVQEYSALYRQALP
jgi:starch synthase